MGLSVVVGVLADLRGSDPDAETFFRHRFADINNVLRSKKLAEHQEPLERGNGLPWRCALSGYNDLHALRRVAVSLLNGRLPAPENGRASADLLLREYYSSHHYRRPMSPGQMSPHHSTPWAFKHLLMHSDNDGFYLPLPFKFVIVNTPQLNVPGELMGSSVRLRQECAALARHMELPLDTDAGFVAEFRGQDSTTQSGWRRFPAAAYTCLQLYRACEVSLAHHAAIAFT
jgi:hypothetical protein